jgi:crotonobetainyl-CoA:carnitine CoA-transferase CaiB-like acyl-CoA transferase
MALTGNEPKRRGNDASSGEPLSSVFDTQAGRLALAVNEPHQFHKLARAVGRAEWIGDPRYATRRARRENRTALRAELSALLSGHTASHWEERLNGAGVAAAVVRSLPQSLQHSGASAEPSLFQLQSGTLRPCELTAPTSPTPSMIAAHLST